MLDKLVGSHTQLAIYPTLTICCQRVVICASLNTGFKGMQVVTYLANIKQFKSYWLKSSPKGLGTCIWINETQFILVMLCSTRGTKIDGVEGLLLVNRPSRSVSENPDNSPEVYVLSPFIVPSQKSMRDHCDIILWCQIICFDILMGKPLHMHTGNTVVYLCICWHQCPNSQLL